MSFNEEEWDLKTQQEVDRLAKEEDGLGKAYCYEIRREHDKKIIKTLIATADELKDTNPDCTAAEFEELILKKIREE